MDIPVSSCEKRPRHGEARLSVGHSEIDRQHGDLFELMANVKELAGRSVPSKEVVKAFRKLVSNCRAHFSYEEQLMRRHGYSNTQRHKDEHDRICQDADAILEDLCQDRALEFERLFEWWRGWSISHVIHEDHQLGEFLARQRK